MGLNEGSNTNKIYLNIVGGKLARRLKEHEMVDGKQVSVDRDIKDRSTGEVIKTVIERHYQDIDGLIVNAEIDTKGDFGSRLVIDIMDDGEEFTIQIPVESNYGRALMTRMPNIDPNIPITLRPYSFEDKDSGKTQSGVVVYQKGRGLEDDKVPYKWTKDNPGSMPSWESTEVAGKKKWNSDKQTNFLCQHFEQWAKKVGAISVEEEVSSDPDALELEKQFAEEQAEKHDTKSAGVPPNKEDTEVDDLPF